MGNTKKRIAVLMTAAAMAAATVTGCGKIDNKATVMTVGDDKVELGVANCFARYQQAMYYGQYGSYLGDKMWSNKISDSQTLEENVKKGILEALQEMYVLEDHMKDYNVELTAEEQEKIKAAAKDFVKENGEEVREVVSGDEETVSRVLELITIQNKMKKAMTADVDTNVTDEEAAQKSMQYVFFSFTKKDDDGNTSTMTDEEKEALKKTAAEFTEGAKTAEDFSAYAKEKGYTATTKTFDAKDTSPSADLIKAADALEVGGFTEPIKVQTGYYVAKVTSLLDREATDTEKKNIVSERQNDKYQEILDGFLKDVKIDVDKKQWKKVSFTDDNVTAKPVEKTDDTTKDTTKDTTDTTK